MRHALGHCNRNLARITVQGMEFSGAAAHSILAQISAELAGTAPDVQAILKTLTRSLSRIRSGTWFAVLLDPDPRTSHVVVAGDSDGDMADYIDKFVKTLAEPTGTPTLMLPQQVIETSSPVLIPSVCFEEFISLLSPAGQNYFSTTPTPHAMEAVGVLVVPMRAGGAIIGTLGIFDWHQQPPLTEADVLPVQLVADHVGLALENARLQTALLDHTERVAVIGAIALAISVGQDLPLTLRVVVEQVTARLEVDAADVLLVTEQGNELFVAASAGFHSSSIPNYRLPAGGWQAGAMDWRPHVEHTRNPDRMASNPRRSLFAREGFQTYVSLPLHARGRLVGVLEIFNRSPVGWDQASLDFLEVLGGTVAVAIDYAGASTGGADKRRAGAPSPRLGDLELEIMRQIVEGQTNREIAVKVHRSENTIKFHVRRILEKTGTINRTELARKATREGWL